MKLQLRILLSSISLFLFSGCFIDPSSYIDCDITAQNEENYAMNDIVIEMQDFTKTSTLECLEGLQEKFPAFGFYSGDECF